MADIIRLLPDNIANQIAAGEVVQRPASVVKELLENAIDAGGRNIRLIVKDAGKTLIQVVDDGIGMTETDARLCFERHATSKIRSSDDLFSIRTMGFRGEAMASIAAVAQVEMRTKQRSQELGIRIMIEGSEIVLQEPCQATAGTSISVKNLFFNVPARRNFLKSDNVEMRHITNEFTQVALAHPDIYFSLHHNGAKIFHLPAGNLRQRIVGILGGKTNQALIPIEEETDIIKIYGYIGKPEQAKKKRGEQYFFVNKRFIKSNYLQHAILQAYEDLLPQKMFPLFVVFLEIDPAKIDVNVHPTKQEIKFEDERLVYNYLRVTARHALAQNSITPSLDFDLETSITEQIEEEERMKEQQTYEKPQYFDSKIGGKKTSLGGSGSGGSWPKKELSPREESNQQNWTKLYEGLLDQEDENAENTEEGTSFESSISNQELFVESKMGNTPLEEISPKMLYQLHNTYIVSPIKSGFLLIDQAAAHQRILFERYLSAMEAREPLTQHQLFPQTVELSTADSELLKGFLPELNAMGIDIKEFGQSSFVIHGLPAEMKEVDIQAMLEELLEQYQLGLNLKLDLEENLARAMSRQAALRPGKSLSQLEMQEIINQLFACELPFQAPNGRKTFITVDLDELKKRFD
jgi:DNA mismatch repair protein MutL